MAGNNASEIGVMDYVIISVKNFSLEQVCAEISPMIDEHTVIVPILNGVGVSDKVGRLIGRGCVLDSLIYITSGSDKEFDIHQTGSYCNIHIGFGKQNKGDERKLSEVVNLFRAAVITCIIEDDIETAIAQLKTLLK